MRSKETCQDDRCVQKLKISYEAKEPRNHRLFNFSVTLYSECGIYARL